jgi:hypothetical protein
MSVTVPVRREGESDIDYLTRKEVCFGLWQSDALERMSQQNQTIEAMQERVRELEATLTAAKVAAEAVAKLVGYGLYSPEPDNFARDISGHINLMGGFHGDPDYLKGGKSTQTCRHVDMRSKPPRAAKQQA